MHFALEYGVPLIVTAHSPTENPGLKNFVGMLRTRFPQVPVEWGWDRDEFLNQTCVKAGLPPDAWRRGADIYAFAAEVFGEKE